MTTNITEESFDYIAAKYYRKRLCFTTKSFYSDLNQLELKGDITRFYNQPSTKKVRAIINKLIIAGNLFGPESVDLILFKLQNIETHFNFVCQLFDCLDLLPQNITYKRNVELETIINAAIDNK